MLPDVRVAPGRPPVVLVSRDGDPASAVAVAITTAGLGAEGGDDAGGGAPEVSTALAGLVEARLRAREVDAVVTPTADGVRASALAASAADAARIASAIREALAGAAGDADLAPAQRKLAALAHRPLRDRALGRWATCVGEPYAPPSRAGEGYADVDLAKLEQWRAAALGLGRVAVAVTGPSAITEAVAEAVLRGPSWSAAAPLPAAGEAPEAAVEVFEIPATSSHAPTVHMTLDVGTSSAAVTTAEALGDPRGPLAARLGELDLPFRLLEVTGAAHAGGGCVGIVLEASPESAEATPPGPELAARVADAVALVRLEAGVYLAEIGEPDDGRALSRRSGDPRESAERAAWWALADLGPAPQRGDGSLALGVPYRRGPKDTAPLEPSRGALAAAVTRATATWSEPVVDARSRVEVGQGEAWVLVASPCGTAAETDADAGLTALFIAAAAEAVSGSSGVQVEPWVGADGAGLLVHGPALAGETPAAHARRLADVAARGFAAERMTRASLTRARAELLARDARRSAGLAVLAEALAPGHPSWVDPWSGGDAVGRSSDATVLLRAQALRAGPVRVAVLANAADDQAEAAARAADRWIARHGADRRACPAATSAEAPRPGTYAAPHRPGTSPEAWIAYPFSPGHDGARAAARVVAALLDGDGGLLAKATSGASPAAREVSAKLLGWPRAPALVIRIAATEASLDDAVMQTRALVDRLRADGPAAADLERALQVRARTALATALDPRARVVATWRGEPVDTGDLVRTSAEDIRKFSREHLGEEKMIIVASRPSRPPAAQP